MRSRKIGLFLVLCGCWALVASVRGQDIVHDAEYYILEAQNGEKWSAEDKELDARLAENGT
jgi:hypothetical protein